MANMAILQPLVALAAWTMVMWVWLYATRIPAIHQVDMAALAADPTLTLDHVLPAKVQWKAHNYNHLHEAPTVFYAVCLVLAVTGQGEGLAVKVAWAYVALRVVHSLVQATVNHIPARFLVFMLSSLCLMALIVMAARVVFAV
jgi:hypothetical protein